MDTITLDLVLKKFEKLCSKPGKFNWVKSVTKDPDKESSLLWQTQFGDFTGRITEEGENLVFQIGDQEIVISAITFLGGMQH